MYVTLAEVIVHREKLSPREAATLTLAVGRAWDRQKALRGDVALPDAESIALHDSGEISFLITPAGGAAGTVPLSALLGRLLGVDGDAAPRQPVPGGLLITLAGRLGPVELASHREDGFRSALVRFADDAPDVLANLFWRVAGARRPAAPPAVARTRTPDRRRQSRAVSELRREIRDIERRAFEARVAKSRALSGAARRRRTYVTVLAVSCATLAFALIAVLLLRGSAAPASRALAAPLAAPADPTPTAAAHLTVPAAADVTLAAAAERAAPRAVPPRTRSVSTPRPASIPRAEKVRRPQPAAAFPGGTRGIAWIRSGS